MPLKVLKEPKEFEKEWEEKALIARKSHPLKGLKNIPEMVQITNETKHLLRWKSFKWMVTKDENFKVMKGFLRRPFFHLKNYLKSIFSKEPYKREGDFFLYGLNSLNEFEKVVKKPEALFLLGFSYCQKPFECPSKRFTDQCINDLSNPICQQCIIGKILQVAPKNVEKVFIPTVHYIGEKIFELLKGEPKREIVFMITACELTLEMFSDWGNMVGIKGVGVRLSGRICNTMKAFELSEKGIKPGLTVIETETEKKMIKLLAEISLKCIT